MEHLTIDELRKREDYYNQYVLSNPYSPLRLKWGKYEYPDKRYENGILINDNIYKLNNAKTEK